MKKLIFILCSVSLVLASCNKNNGNDECNGANTAELNGTWKMVSVIDNATGTIVSKPAAIKAEVEISFSAAGSAKGILAGHTPSNTIYGSEYTTDCNRSFTISCLFITKVMENEWGILFVDHIRNSSKYNFESDGKLSITTTNKTLIFARL